MQTEMKSRAETDDMIERLVSAAVDLGVPEQVARTLPALADAFAHKSPSPAGDEEKGTVIVLALRRRDGGSRDNAAVLHALHAASLYAKWHGFWEIGDRLGFDEARPEVFSDEDFALAAAAIDEAKSRRHARIDAIDRAAAERDGDTA